MSGEIILYTTEDGRAAIQLKAKDGSVWLTQAEIAELFEVTPQAITQHIRAVYDDAEWDEAATCKSFLQVRTEGSREVSRQIAHYFFLPDDALKRLRHTASIVNLIALPNEMRSNNVETLCVDAVSTIIPTIRRV